MVMYDHDNNAILTKPMKSCSQESLVLAFTYIHQYLLAHGWSPTMHKINNEAPPALKLYFKKHNIDYQLVPPNNHCCNAAECAIQTFKHHFIAGLCTTHAQWPMSLWRTLLPQCVFTL